MNPDKVTKFTVKSGKEYTFYFGMKALRTFEIETGKGIMAVFQQGTLLLQELAILIKQGLIQAHPQITIDDVDLIIDEVGIDVVLDLAMDALRKGLPLVGNRVAPLAVANQTNGVER